METCICCGEPIPEGRQVCPKCEADGKTYKSLLDSNVYTPVAYPQGGEEVQT